MDFINYKGWKINEDTQVYKSKLYEIKWLRVHQTEYYKGNSNLKIPPTCVSSNQLSFGKLYHKARKRRA